MLGIGLPDLFFIAVLFLLFVKPAEWPKVARTAARVFSGLMKAVGPVLDEVRGVRDSLMAEAVRERPEREKIPADWSPSPQGQQKGGEPPSPSGAPEQP